MTTIAWDGKMLCADSMIVGGYIVQGHQQKLFVFSDGPYIAAAFCGASGNVDAFTKWILDGERPEIDNDFSVGALAIGRDGKIYQFDSEVLGRVAEFSPAAHGSGSGFAMGAMVAGASAFRAIEIASRLDVRTGGPVQCFDTTTGILLGPFGEDERC